MFGHEHEFHPESGWCTVCGTTRIDGRITTKAGQVIRPGTGPDWREPPPEPTLFDPTTGEVFA